MAREERDGIVSLCSHMRKLRLREVRQIILGDTFINGKAKFATQGYLDLMLTVPLLSYSVI